ncbi:MAG: prolipoprotein diacylglyceryl transferase [Nannocystaceae bacterium]|nr:prolipoprotein diacylglyceryl transferase [Myxococcales bacterium]
MAETSSTASEPLSQESTGVLRFIRNFHNQTILFRVGHWIVVTYGLVAATAFLVGYSTGVWYTSMLGMDAYTIAAFFLFFLIPSVLMGARATSVLLEWRELFRRPLQTLVKPGYMLHGGVFGGMLALAVYTILTGTPAPPLYDALGFLMPLGEAICRLGCFVYGCCWGKPTESRFGVAYTSPHAKVIRCHPELHGVKIHPAQMYALSAHLIQFTIFYLLLPYKAFDGMFAGLYLITHPIIRVILERFRQDDRGKLVGRMTHTNLYSAIQVLLGSGFLIYGAASGQNLAIDVSTRYLDTLANPELTLMFIGVFLVALLSFGVHYRKVGSWVTHGRGGVAANVDEMSMGAAFRAEGHGDDCPECDGHDHR